MKWITAVSVLIALVAVVALGLVLKMKIGVALPPKLEDMTIEGDGLLVTNVNLHISVLNLTHREISVDAVLDGSVAFAAALIRDEHFGSCDLGTHVAPGTHSLQVLIAGRPPSTNSFVFTTTPAVTNYIVIGIFGDKQGYKFKMKQSDKPRWIM